MNWAHLRTFLWLRWRLLANQWRRGGRINAVLMTIIMVGVPILAIPLFIGCFFLGLYTIPKAAPVHLMYVADAIVLVFLFLWTVGLVSDLQRTEPLSLSKFMHLPVTVREAFFINYISSLLRLSLIIFGPILLGFCLALILTKGILLVTALPLTAAFLLMISALTYQFQGWLASLMTNPRRRRTVVVTMTAVIILMSQLPNLFNVYRMAALTHRDNPAIKSVTLTEEIAKLDRVFQAHEIDAKEYVRRQNEILQKARHANAEVARQATARKIEPLAKILNIVLPIGWLPLGIGYAAEGNVLPSLLGLFGMTLIGSVSLWRAYHTTVGIYQGKFTSRKIRQVSAVAPSAGSTKPRANLLEMRLPVVSEFTSVIALASLRSLIRSPEAKMMLMTPLIMGGVFGSMLLSGGHNRWEAIRPLIGIGAMAIVLMGVMQPMSNQFGFDRDGFRVFVLCAAPRRDILLGKNLAFAPLVLGLGFILLAILQAVCPMRIDKLFAMFPQYLSMFLMCCLFTNVMSIFTPMHIPAGSLRASNFKMSTFFLMMVMGTFVFPLTQAVTLLPLGIEALLKYQGWISSTPVCLILSLTECTVIVFLYLVLLKWQGVLLQEREQKILDVVTGRDS